MTDPMTITLATSCGVACYLAGYYRTLVDHAEYGFRTVRHLLDLPETDAEAGAQSGEA